MIKLHRVGFTRILAIVCLITCVLNVFAEDTLSVHPLVQSVIQNGEWEVLTIKLHKSQLYGLSKSELSIIRNTMAACHGFNFKSSDLKDHFSYYNWYNPLEEGVSVELTQVEIANNDLIWEMESVFEQYDPAEIYRAIDEADMDKLRLFVSNGVTFGFIGLYTSPLFRAIENNHVEIARFLIDNGSDVNQELEFDGGTGQYTKTPLWHAL